jgi:hypothetical protein
MINYKLAILFIITFIINIFFLYTSHNNGSKYYNDRINKNKTTPKLFDISYKYLPDYTDDPILLFFINFSVSIFPLILHYLFGYTILEEYSYYLILIFLVRMIMINLTILPKIKKCNIDMNAYSWLNGHCYD